MDITRHLILGKRLPRSPGLCTSKLRGDLRYLDAVQATPTDSLQKVDLLLRKNLSHEIVAIFQHGRHEFVQAVLGHLADLAGQVELDFCFCERPHAPEDPPRHALPLRRFGPLRVAANLPVDAPFDFRFCDAGSLIAGHLCRIAADNPCFRSVLKPCGAALKDAPDSLPEFRLSNA